MFKLLTNLIVETRIMENPLLDTALRYVVGRDVRLDPLNPYANPGEARLHELKRLFSHEEAEAVEDAYRRAAELLSVSCELADLERGPRNDHTGPSFDMEALTRRCPGFSRATYEAALAEGFMLTR
jgi:hypothetical protein